MKIKRSHKIITSLFLAIIVWFFGIDNNTISLQNKFILPILVVGIIGIASFGHVLWKVNQLKDHP